MRKHRGGFTGIELILLVGVIGLVGFFAAPAVGKSVNTIFSGNQNQQKQVRKLQESYTMFYKDDKGNFKPAPVPYKRIEEELNFVRQEPQETLWQKFMKLGAMAVVIIVLLSYLGLWPVIALWWNKKVRPKIEAAQEALENEEAQHYALKEDARRIVISVDEGLGVMNTAIDKAYTIANAATDQKVREEQIRTGQTLEQVKRDFLTAMSRKQDTSTKDLVRELLKND